MKVKIIDLDHKGNGIAKRENKIVFIPKCIPSDLVDIDIIKSHKKYDEGRIKEVIDGSINRIDSICPYYNVCGGCNISNLNYYEQLEYKRNKVINIFKRYLNTDINPDIIGSDSRYEYRNKITYKCVDGKLGLVSIDNEFLDVDRCYLVSDKVNELVGNISLLKLDLVNSVVIKECDNGLIVSFSGSVDVSKIKNLCLCIYINDECVYKREDGYISINEIKYKVSKDSFFQVNTNNISSLYDVVIKYGNFKKDDNVVDLYCGVGSISLYVSRYVGSVLGIEIIEDAIKDASENAKINNIDNTKFVCGDVSKLIDDNTFGNKIIVDPPRSGLDNHTIEVLNTLNIERLIYVSCDPMTLVRDLKRLECYTIEDVTLVDMFPQTHHVETICLLYKS